MDELLQAVRNRARRLRRNREKVLQRKSAALVRQQQTEATLQSNAERMGLPVPEPGVGRWLRTAGEIIDYLGICERTLYYWMKQKNSPPIKKIRGSLNTHTSWIDQWRTNFPASGEG